MVKAVLIDDELDSLETLSHEISIYCKEIEILKLCLTPEEGLEAILSLRPDLVFLDIEMPGMNGFSLLKRLDHVDFDIIFVTAYDRYAVNAFEFNAVDYLLKPILKTKLVDAVQKVLDKRTVRLDSDHLDALINNVSLQVNNHIRNIALPTAEGFDFVAIDDIMYVKAESNYCWVMLSTNQKYLLSRTLKDISSIVRGPQFFRTHQSYLININFASRYVRGQGGYILLSDGTQIPVSRSRKDELIGWLKGKKT